MGGQLECSASDDQTVFWFTVHLEVAATGEYQYRSWSRRPSPFDSRRNSPYDSKKNSPYQSRRNSPHHSQKNSPFVSRKSSPQDSKCGTAPGTTVSDSSSSCVLHRPMCCALCAASACYIYSWIAISASLPFSLPSSLHSVPCTSELFHSIPTSSQALTLPIASHVVTTHLSRHVPLFPPSSSYICPTLSPTSHLPLSHIFLFLLHVIPIHPLLPPPPPLSGTPGFSPAPSPLSSALSSPRESHREGYLNSDNMRYPGVLGV